jgi:hypothetical protein
MRKWLAVLAIGLPVPVAAVDVCTVCEDRRSEASPVGVLGD